MNAVAMPQGIASGAQLRTSSGLMWSHPRGHTAVRVANSVVLEGAIDHAHATTAELLYNAIVGNSLAD